MPIAGERVVVLIRAGVCRDVRDAAPRRADASDEFGIGGEAGVGRVQDRRLGDRLGDEEAVERVAVEERQIGDVRCHARMDRQFDEADIARLFGDGFRPHDEIRRGAAPP